MHTSKTTNILIGICLLLSVTLSATGSKKDTLHLRHFASDLRYIPEMQTRAADSIYQPGYGKVGKSNLDTLFSRCAAVGYEAMPDEIEWYYEEVLDPTPEKAVNSVCGKTFSVYINEFRVRYAILLLSDPANDPLSLETIAFDSGFSNRMTFYRAFKAQTGINPANYRRNR